MPCRRCVVAVVVAARTASALGCRSHTFAKVHTDVDSGALASGGPPVALSAGRASCSLAQQPPFTVRCIASASSLQKGLAALWRSQPTACPPVRLCCCPAPPRSRPGGPGCRHRPARRLGGGDPGGAGGGGQPQAAGGEAGGGRGEGGLSGRTTYEGGGGEGVGAWTLVRIAGPKWLACGDWVPDCRGPGGGGPPHGGGGRGLGRGLA